MRLVRPLTGVSPDDFWSRVNVRQENQCWLWKGGTNSDGYGYFKQRRVNRLAYYFSTRRSPKKLVCHSCNTRLCCNPKHLYDGTHVDNMRDMSLANNHDGKNRRGEKHPNSKLSNAETRLIRSSKLPGTVLAQRFNVSAATISMIRQRKRRHKS